MKLHQRLAAEHILYIYYRYTAQKSMQIRLICSRVRLSLTLYCVVAISELHCGAFEFIVQWMGKLHHVTDTQPDSPCGCPSMDGRGRWIVQTDVNRNVYTHMYFMYIIHTAFE